MTKKENIKEWQVSKKKALAYISGIKSGKIPACKWVKLAVKRHKKDLKRQNTPGFPYEFKESYAEHVLKGFSILKHGKGKWRGEPFELLTYFAAILWMVYGWRHTGISKKRFRKVYIRVPRKNAKTENLAGVGVYGFAYEKEIDPEVFWFATKKDQAKIGWDRQKIMTEQLRKDSPKFAKHCDTSSYRIYTKEGLGFVAYLGQDSKTEDAHAPYYALGDEYHAHVSNDMINVMEDGMGSRESPMTWLITTSGYNILGPCKKFEETGESVLQGKIPGDEIFFIMYGADKGDDWEDPATWIKANPAYHEIDTLPGYLESQYKLAKTEGGEKEVSFKTKNLCEWVRASKIWITDKLWTTRGSDWQLSDCKGSEAFAAWDLSSNRDLTCFGILFPPNPAKGWNTFRFWAHYYCPEENARERSIKDRAPYLDWAKAGYLTLTPGDWIDYEYIENDIAKSIGDFTVRGIGYDKWQSNRTAQDFIKEGAPCNPFPQTCAAFNEPINFLEGLVSKDQPDQNNQPKLDHRNCPVLRWMIGNAVFVRNATGLRKFDKERSREKIDGAVVLGMCIGEYLHYLAENPGNAYEQGVRYL